MVQDYMNYTIKELCYEVIQGFLQFLLFHPPLPLVWCQFLALPATFLQLLLPISLYYSPQMSYSFLHSLRKKIMHLHLKYISLLVARLCCFFVFSKVAVYLFVLQELSLFDQLLDYKENLLFSN